MGSGTELVGPMGVAELWDCVRTDSAHHAVYWVAEWPRSDIHPGFLQPLLLAPGARRAFTLIAEPLSAAAALREIRRAKVEHTADAAQRARIGRLEDASTRAEADDLLRREQDLVGGHGDLRFAGLITVSAESRAGARGRLSRHGSRCSASDVRAASPGRPARPGSCGRGPSAGKGSAVSARAPRGATGTSAFATRSPHWRTGSPMRVAAHRASSATLAGAYPFLAPAPADVGVYVGVDALTGGPFCFDPWALYTAGVLTNPNVLLAGVIGQGKSALAKSLAVRSIAAGRRVYVPGDPKGEWAPVAHAVGGTVVSLGQGLATRLNPLDPGSPPRHGDPVAWRAAGAAGDGCGCSRRSRRRPWAGQLVPVEHGALDAALTEAERHTTPTVRHVVAALIDPDQGAGHPRHHQRRDSVPPKVVTWPTRYVA